MNGIPDNIDDKELMEIANRIAKPAYKFFMKKIESEMLRGYYKDMNLDVFITIVINCMASVDGNLLRWLSGFCENITGANIYEKITQHFYESLKSHCETKIGKN